MSKILYLMHIDWGWIKQRPHFLAEELAKYHELMVVYRLNPSRKSMGANDSPVERRSFLPIPRLGNPALEFIDNCAQKMMLSGLIKRFKPDVIWVTFPTICRYLPTSAAGIPIVYDCMDDAGGFHGDSPAGKRVLAAEADRVKTASRIICSSQTLCDRIAERYGVPEKVALVRNALPASDLEAIVNANSSEDRVEKEFTDLAYFGSIASWFDFESVLRLLDELPKLPSNLIGPPDHPIPEHDRLIYHGCIERGKLHGFVRKFDGFIMPFKINPLIEGVDPVKLYEYIALGKETIAVRYREIERFKPYIHLYSSYDELREIAKKMCDGSIGRKAGDERAQEFLLENTWTKRAEAVEEILAELSGGKPSDI